LTSTEKTLTGAEARDHVKCTANIKAEHWATLGKKVYATEKNFRLKPKAKLKMIRIFFNFLKPNNIVLDVSRN
jgi:hypothetical protein